MAPQPLQTLLLLTSFTKQHYQHFKLEKTDGGVYGTIGIIPFNVIVLNQGNCFNGTTFIAPSAGVYHLHFICQSTNNGLIVAMKSGSVTLFERYSGMAQDSGGGGYTVYLIAGQTVHLELLFSTLWAGNNMTAIQFGGFKIG